jgi:hypothetical protein
MELMHPSSDPVPLTAADYRERLIALLVRSGQQTLPRRSRDLAVLLIALSRRFADSGPLSERQATERIAAWLQETGRALDVDPVSLRRALIDAGFLERTPAGTEYVASRRYEREIAIEPALLAIDPDQVIDEERERIAARRRLHRTS